MKLILFLMLMNVSLSTMICQQEEPKILWTTAWSPDGKYIATGGNRTDLMIYNAADLTLFATYPVEDVIIARVKWHPTENKLAVITQSKTFKAKILDLDNKRWLELDSLEDSFRALDWNHDGSMLAISHLSKDISIYKADGSRFAKFQADPKGVTDLDWHPKKNILISVGSEIGLYDLKGERLSSWQPRDVETFILCVEWHQDGKFFIVGDYGDLEKAENKLVQAWDENGELLYEIRGGEAEYRNIRWDKSGKRFASASEALRIWDEHGSLIAESDSSDDYLWGIDWSPDGKMIVTSSNKGVLTLWNDRAEKINEIMYSRL